VNQGNDGLVEYVKGSAPIDFLGTKSMYHRVVWPSPRTAENRNPRAVGAEAREYRIRGDQEKK
jgi:hypothetical protein